MIRNETIRVENLRTLKDLRVFVESVETWHDDSPIFIRQADDTQRDGSPNSITVTQMVQS